MVDKIDDKDKQLQELAKAYEQFSANMKKLIVEQNDVLKEALAIYTSAKMESFSDQLEE